MVKKVNFSEILCKSKKLQVVFFFISMSIIVIGYILTVKPIKWKVAQDKMLGFELTEDYTLLATVDGIENTMEKVVISGWALHKESVNSQIFVSLQNTKNLEEIVLKTNMVDCDEIETYIYGNWDFGTIGFEATIEKERVQQDVCYKVLIGLSYEEEDVYKNKIVYEKKVFTSCYLYDGELYAYNPSDFIKPDFLNKELVEVVNSGKVCAYNFELGMWIYLYNNVLYWITDDSFKFSGTGLTHVPVHYRSYSDENYWTDEMKQDGFENRDIRFEKSELEIEDQDYRVAKQDISFEYPISYIVTGVYDDESNTWIWKQKINMLSINGLVHE